MPRRRRVELSTNHERWLISYSDFVTLLFAFFVVMYSISQVNESKYRVLSDTLQDAFNVAPHAINPIQVGDPSLSRDPSVIENTDPSYGEQLGQGAFDKMAELPSLSEQVSQQLADLVDEDLVKINSNEFWLQIELNSSILFSSGRASPSDQAKEIFSSLAGIFKGFDNPIQVEGFTDDIPIRSNQYPSNWELSAARAAATVQLLAEGGVRPQQMSAVGYGEYQPIARNDSPEGRAQNRRVVLMVAREKIQRPEAPPLEALEQVLKQDISAEGGAISTGADIDSESVESGSIESILALPADSDDSNPSGRVSELPDITVDAVLPEARGVQAVELEDGGLLFSSDPNLPRQ